ncbi:hypothetical protein [Legionella yabuuchiae]|uniref:hypothetical protein n=1 Tax=Legionella yabuuchiae TaxID=376727 RepID=UPI001055B412|nr:hypothetical protein [Legionella yabuuchiae]
MPKKGEEKMNEGASGDSLSLLEQLPTELIQKHIAPCLSGKALAALSNSSTTMFSHCQSPAAKRLISHVVKGEEAEALEMIDANPRLLLIPSQATDYSGRSYTGFMPFQVALLCHDVTLWKKIEPYFDTLPNGQEEKARQFKALFPQGLPKQEPYDFNTLVQVITNSSIADITAAIYKADNDTTICHALKGFRATFTDLAMKETFFNPLHLIEALKVYDAQFDYWSSNQKALFLPQVIGYIQRFLPTSYAQALCQGLNFVVEEKKPLYRSLKFQYEHGVSYFPLDDSSGLGFDFGVFEISGSAGILSAAWPRVTFIVRKLDKLSRANTAELFRLEHRIQHDGQSIKCLDTLSSRSCCEIF